MSSFPLIRQLPSLRGYAISAAGILAGTVAAAPLHADLDLSNVALLYVLAVVLAGARYGRGVAIFSAIFGALVFAYVFVPPYFSLAITELQYLLSALIMLVVAVLVGHLTANLRAHAEIVEAQASQTRALYEFARQLTATSSSAEVIEAGRVFLAQAVDAGDVEFVAADDEAAGVPVPLLQAALAGRRLATQAGGVPATGFAVLPLVTARSAHGVIAFRLPIANTETDAQREFIETVGSLIAVALERTHYAEVAHEIALKHAAESLRNTILSSLSHDIRTPLTALVGTADTLMLAQPLAPEKQRALLAGLREQANSIHQFVNNLLDMARLQSGTVELNLAWQPVEEVVGATLQQIRPVAGAREIGVRIAADLPPLRIDAVLIERALWNLVENALKYSPAEQPIEIDISRCGDLIDIVVCDRGPGLPPGDGDALFGVFARGRSESNVPGVGLGLAIARSIAEVHHGSLRATPRPGGGSCFHLGLPVGQPPCLNLEGEA